MKGQDDLVQVLLTKEEAYELLMRCLKSDEDDTPEFRNALRSLARAIEGHGRPTRMAA